MAKKQQQSNYLAACQKLGLVPKEAPQGDATDRDKYDYHAHVIAVCVAAENAIEQPDGSFKEWKNPKDGTVVGYEPWFKRSGSGWVYYDYVNWGTASSVGPRLEYFDLTVMKAAVKKLATEYNNYFNS